MQHAPWKIFLGKSKNMIAAGFAFANDFAGQVAKQTGLSLVIKCNDVEFASCIGDLGIDLITGESALQRFGVLEQEKMLLPLIIRVPPVLAPAQCTHSKRDILKNGVIKKLGSVFHDLNHLPIQFYTSQGKIKRRKLMPIYEFRCNNCSEKTEKLCRLGETGEALACPSCGSNGLKKIFSLIQRKGSPGDGAGGCGSCSSSNCGSCH